MAVVELDGGGRFYGQVVPSARVAIGDRVRLVPRRLHDGGGAAQYFWKVARELMPISGEVAIMGAATTAFGVLHERGYTELIAEAAFGALDDAGLGLDRSAPRGSARPSPA